MGPDDLMAFLQAVRIRCLPAGTEDIGADRKQITVVPSECFLYGITIGNVVCAQLFQFRFHDCFPSFMVIGYSVQALT